MVCYIQGDGKMEREYNESAKKKDTYNHKQFPSFYHMPDIKYTPSNNRIF